MSSLMMMPWAPHALCYCAPRRVIFTLALGENPNLPARAPVLRGQSRPATVTGHNALDRVLNAFGGNVHLTRIHSPANPDAGFDLTEHSSGLSRTYVASFSDHNRIDQLTDALRQLAVVTQATADYFVTTHDAPIRSVPSQDHDWPWQMIGATQARTVEQGDPSITTAVLDTGAAQQHDEISGRLSAGFDAVNFTSEDLSQGMSLIGDFSTRDIDPDEAINPHGTACLALIGGHGRSMPEGLARQTSLMPVRVLASAQSPDTSAKKRVVGVGALSDIDYAIKRAVDLGAKVMNCSFGTAERALSPGDPVPHADTTAYALERGTIMIAASGNSGQQERYYPAATDGVIAVGSVGANGRPSAFSTKGDHVALSAPGEAVRTPAIDGYDYATGTSFAAPFVAGAAALLVARARRSARPLDSAMMRDLLMTSARPFAASEEGSGAGILDVPAALTAIDHHSTNATTLAAMPAH